ncbi:hypothetical protein C0J52_15105 [Blattella germanica]|nr:hypothetical protein C0J52_15105 [Blattella germanica]
MKNHMITVSASVLVLLVLGQLVSSQVCPQCKCQPVYNPVCGINDSTGKYRGFSNKCILECSNTCKPNKFKYLGPGRCGPYKSTTAANVLKDSIPTGTNVTNSENNKLQ